MTTAGQKGHPFTCAQVKVDTWVRGYPKMSQGAQQQRTMPIEVGLASCGGTLSHMCAALLK